MTWTVGIAEVAVLPGTPLAGYVPGAPADELLDLPCYCWLLTGGGGAVMVDSGPDVALSGDVGYEVRQAGGQPLLQALASREVQAADVRAIVHTHLHQDHVQNDHLFPEAEVIVRRRELETALRGEERCQSLSATARKALAAAPYAQSQEAGLWYVGTAQTVRDLGERLRVVEGEIEVLGGVTVVPNGGHTEGHQSVLVSTAEGPVCISGHAFASLVHRHCLAMSRSRPG